MEWFGGIVSCISFVTDEFYLFGNLLGKSSPSHAFHYQSNIRNYLVQFEFVVLVIINSFFYRMDGRKSFCNQYTGPLFSVVTYAGIGLLHSAKHRLKTSPASRWIWVCAPQTKQKRSDIFDLLYSINWFCLSVSCCFRNIHSWCCAHVDHSW